ncbi:hypothetical protein DN069_12235 [Streptacidiphilus pinicola]|uniref:Uncharacterized protein n=1 Tax=Streptacidiphilus pinicola TaxID=2219663 RepID=A0A2X0IJL3_9ACTN|nr:hypothetical protein DN069_12235 [Streptacidiphilus pinicola]
MTYSAGGEESGISQEFASQVRAGTALVHASALQDPAAADKHVHAHIRVHRPEENRAAMRYLVDRPVAVA